MNNYSFFNLRLHIKDCVCDLFKVILDNFLFQRPLNVIQHLFQVSSFEEFKNLVNFTIALKNYVYDFDDVFMTEINP